MRSFHAMVILLLRNELVDRAAIRLALVHHDGPPFRYLITLMDTDKDCAIVKQGRWWKQI